MVIDDLDHIQSVTERNNIEGGVLTVIPPSINLQAVVRAGAIPTTLNMMFAGEAIGSEYAFLRVIQEGYLRARSPI